MENEKYATVRVDDLLHVADFLDGFFDERDRVYICRSFAKRVYPIWKEHDIDGRWKRWADGDNAVRIDMYPTLDRLTEKAAANGNDDESIAVIYAAKAAQHAMFGQLRECYHNAMESLQHMIKWPDRGSRDAYAAEAGWFIYALKRYLETNAIIN